MSADILQFIPRALPADGGKARILRKHGNFKFRTPSEPSTLPDHANDLLMDHVDTGIPSDVAYHAPERDPA